MNSGILLVFAAFLRRESEHFFNPEYRLNYQSFRATKHLDASFFFLFLSFFFLHCTLPPLLYSFFFFFDASLCIPLSFEKINRIAGANPPRYGAVKNKIYSRIPKQRQKKTNISPTRILSLRPRSCPNSYALFVTLNDLLDCRHTFILKVFSINDSIGYDLNANFIAAK